jgi:hypothetical protein
VSQLTSYDGNRWNTDLRYRLLLVGGPGFRRSLAD